MERSGVEIKALGLSDTSCAVMLYLFIFLRSITSLLGSIFDPLVFWTSASIRATYTEFTID